MLVSSCLKTNITQLRFQTLQYFTSKKETSDFFFYISFLLFFLQSQYFTCRNVNFTPSFSQLLYICFILLNLLLTPLYPRHRIIENCLLLRLLNKAVATWNWIIYSHVTLEISIFIWCLPLCTAHWIKVHLTTYKMEMRTQQLAT